MTYYRSETVTLHHGDSLEVAQTLPAGSVNCIVTSPPYYGLRDYGQTGQYGLEATPAEYVENMRALFSELRRVLTNDGTLWLNLGDTYGKGKQLLGIPWRVALALQDNGWILRNSIIWHKTSALPDPTKDRFTRRHELHFLFTKSKKYWFDLDPVREPLAEATLKRDRTPRGRSQNGGGSKESMAGFDYTRPGLGDMKSNPAGKNPGDVWRLNPQPFKGAHFAVMPQELIRRSLLSGCKPGGVVLDPFSGSGTTGMVARELGLKYIGIDVSAEYLDLSLETRLQLEVRA